MANPYVAKTWLDRISEYPTRRLLTSTSDPTDTKEVYVTRQEGEVSEQGDPYTALNMNGLESRINAAFAKVPETLSGTVDPLSSDGKNGDTYYKTETEGGVTSIVGMFVKISGEWLEVSVGATLPQAEGSGF